MKIFALAALAAALGLAACQPAPPPPPPPPPPVDITGRVVDMAGNCHGIQSESGGFAVRPGVIMPPIRVGSRVRVIGVVDPAQDCPGRTLVRDARVELIVPPPRMRRTTTTVPK